MSTEVKVTTLPDCDICKAQKAETINRAEYDGATTHGPWAYMCQSHFLAIGLGLGTGRGQKLILRAEKPSEAAPSGADEQAERIKENLKGVDYDNLSLADFEDLFEDRDPMEFL
jgi:hypothetical protein